MQAELETQQHFLDNPSKKEWERNIDPSQIIEEIVAIIREVQALKTGEIEKEAFCDFLMALFNDHKKNNHYGLAYYFEKGNSIQIPLQSETAIALYNEINPGHNRPILRGSITCTHRELQVYGIEFAFHISERNEIRVERSVLAVSVKYSCDSRHDQPKVIKNYKLLRTGLFN